MKKIRAFLRLVLFLAATAQRIVIILAGRPFSKDPNFVLKQMQKWTRAGAKAVGLKIEYQGKVPESAALFLPNHRSYIDIVLIPSKTLCTFLAKAEMRKWPLIGYGAYIAHCVFVNRKDPDNRIKAREALRERLKQGYSLVVFPEGSTFNPPELGRLHGGMFHVASEGNIGVVPVAIDYKDPADAWGREEYFVSHFLQCFGKKRTEVKVRFGELMHDEDPMKLKERVRVWLEKNTTELIEEWGIERETV